MIVKKVSMVDSNIKDVRKAVNRFACNNKSFAERLVFHNGIKGDITIKSVVEELGCDIFDREGKMTKDGFESVKEILRVNDLPSDATWYDALKKSHKNWLASPYWTSKNEYTVFDYMENPDYVEFSHRVVIHRNKK